jgi:hypothetical protein
VVVIYLAAERHRSQAEALDRRVRHCVRDRSVGWPALTRR